MRCLCLQKDSFAHIVVQATYYRVMSAFSLKEKALAVIYELFVLISLIVQLYSLVQGGPFLW